MVEAKLTVARIRRAPEEAPTEALSKIDLSAPYPARWRALKIATHDGTTDLEDQLHGF